MREVIGPVGPLSAVIAEARWLLMVVTEEASAVLVTYEVVRIDASIETAVLMAAARFEVSAAIAAEFVVARVDSELIEVMSVESTAPSEVVIES